MNCRSASGKQEEIFQYIEENDPDILTLSETWWDESVLNSVCEPNNYSLIRKDRCENYKKKYGKEGMGGGVAILHKSWLKVEVIKPVKEELEEILWVYIKGKTNFIVGVVYIADYCEFLNEKSGESILEKHIKEINTYNCGSFLLGDFNIDLLNNKNTKKNKTTALKSVMDIYGFQQKINKPTRVDKNTRKKSLLDHIWTNSNNIISWGVKEGVSDHFGTFIVTTKEKEQNKPSKIKIRNFKNYEPEKFSSDLKALLTKCEINLHLKNNDPNLATTELINVIVKTLDEHAPFIEIFPKDKKIYIPWYNDELRQKIKRKKEMLVDSRTHGFKIYKKPLKSLTNLINALKQTLKKEYIQKKLEEAGEDPKKIWALINALTGRNAKEIIEPENLTQENVDKHNKFFATIGKKIQEQFDIDLETITKEWDFPAFEFQKINSSTVSNLIDFIKKDVAIGYDGISAKIIKDTKNVLGPILAEIINLSYSTKIFPDCLKKAVVKPIYKKDSNNTNLISNYRPISILPVISKIFEKDAANQLANFLEENTLLSLYQHAYRKGHSTITCLFELINFIYETRDLTNKNIAIITLDLSKAFDSIHHGLLLKKLKNLNINENSLEYIGSYLSNRKQVTKFSSLTSNEEEIESGVPQGSILGPLLFLCFVNDLPKTFENMCSFLSYADDTQLIVQAENIEI